VTKQWTINFKVVRSVHFLY